MKGWWRGVWRENQYRNGLFFSETGSFEWIDIAEGIAKAGYKLGVFKDAEVKKIGLKEAAERWTGGDTQLAEDGFASKYVYFSFSFSPCPLPYAGLFTYLGYRYRVQEKLTFVFTVRVIDLKRAVKSWDGNRRRQRKIGMQIS